MLKLEKEGKLRITKRTAKLYMYSFSVNNWNVQSGRNRLENGHKIAELENEAKSILAESFGTNSKNFLVSTNVLYYDKVKLKTGREGTFWIGYRLSKSVPFNKLYFAPLIESTQHLLIRKVILRIERKNDNIFDRRKNIFAKTDNKHNDCVYNAILKAFNYDKSMLPKRINSAKRFKKHFGFLRDQGIPIFRIVEELQTILKCSIVIVGKESYTPKQILPKNITLKYDNEHVTLMNNKGKSSTGGITFAETKPSKIYSIMWDDNNNAIIYNGEEKIKINDSNYDHMLNVDKIMFIKVRALDDNLEEVREKYLKKADYFKETTKGLINFYKSGKHSPVAFEMWRQLSRHIAEPEALEPYEHIPLVEANKGGVHYAKEGVYKHCTDYDINMMYQYFLSHNNFTFPMRKPDFVGAITTDELREKKYLQYGLYKCAIQKGSIWIPEKYAEEYSWFPHYILMIALNEKLDIKMCDDGEANIILYTHSRVNGNIAFGEFTKRLYDIKQKAKDTEYEEDAKLLTSCFWGYFGSKKKHHKTIGEDEAFDEDDYDILEERPLDNGGYRLTYIDKVEKLKFAYARISTFLTGYCRYQFYTLLQKNGISNDSIVVLNTDGCVLKNRIRLNDDLIGNEAGKFKIAKKVNKMNNKLELLDDVTIQVNNSNSYFKVS